MVLGPGGLNILDSLRYYWNPKPPTLPLVEVKRNRYWTNQYSSWSNQYSSMDTQNQWALDMFVGICLLSLKEFDVIRALHDGLPQ